MRTTLLEICCTFHVDLLSTHTLQKAANCWLSFCRKGARRSKGYGHLSEPAGEPKSQGQCRNPTAGISVAPIGWEQSVWKKPNGLLGAWVTACRGSFYVFVQNASDLGIDEWPGDIAECWVPRAEPPIAADCAGTAKPHRMHYRKVDTPCG